MKPGYPLHWPEGWPRTHHPEKSRFDTSLAGAIKNVEESLKRFAADSGRKLENLALSSNYALMQSNPKDSGVALYFTWDGLATCIAVDRYLKIEENLQAIHHVIEAERTKLRHGGLNLVRAAFRGYAALPPPSSAKDPLQVLGFVHGGILTKQIIETAYKQKARKAHPDAGGTAAMMAELNEAKQTLLDRLP